MSRLHQRFLYDGVDNSRLPELSFGQSSTNRAGLSFPLGTGLVVLIILVVSALFSFCYHWLRLRKLGSSTTTTPPFTHHPPQATSDSCCKLAPPSKLDMLQCPPVVYMAGDEMPRFIALPCPFEGASRKASSAEDAPQQSVPKSLDHQLTLDIRL